MKTKKLIVIFFTVIGFLTEIYGSEKHESYIYIGQDQSISRHAPSIETDTDNNSILLDMKEQDPVSNIKWNWIACCTCTALTTGLVVFGYLLYLDHQLQHLSIGK